MACDALYCLVLPTALLINFILMTKISQVTENCMDRWNIFLSYSVTGSKNAWGLVMFMSCLFGCHRNLKITSLSCDVCNDLRSDLVSIETTVCSEHSKWMMISLLAARTVWSTKRWVLFLLDASFFRYIFSGFPHQIMCCDWLQLLLMCW